MCDCMAFPFNLWNNYSLYFLIQWAVMVTKISYKRFPMLTYLSKIVMLWYFHEKYQSIILGIPIHLIIIILHIIIIPVLRHYRKIEALFSTKAYLGICNLSLPKSVTFKKFCFMHGLWATDSNFTSTYLPQPKNPWMRTCYTVPTSLFCLVFCANITYVLYLCM